MSFFFFLLLLNTKEEILKNVGNHPVDGIDLVGQNTKEVNSYHKLSGYQHSSKYLLLKLEFLGE